MPAHLSKIPELRRLQAAAAAHEMAWEGVDLINLLQDGGQVRTLVNTVVNLRAL
jgi:hypothetical protein